VERGPWIEKPLLLGKEAAALTVSVVAVLDATVVALASGIVWPLICAPPVAASV
jgi:hypothetical protein